MFREGGLSFPRSTVSKRSVTLTIAGQTLSIRTDAPQKTLDAIVARVDGRVDAIRRGAPSTPTAKVHLLAALTFAEEILAAERALAEAESALAERAADDGAAEQLRGERSRRRAVGRQLDLLARDALEALDGVDPSGT